MTLYRYRAREVDCPFCWSASPDPGCAECVGKGYVDVVTPLSVRARWQT